MGQIETFDFTPDPISLLESNRNLGYSIEEAISDLIDNSISAGATQIIYEIHWNEGRPYFLLKDNGRGMSNENDELINSFRLGSKNPLSERASDDLGRFGFGMKTASLSQARALTVFTKKKEQGILGVTLDLNFIKDQNGKWLLKTADKGLFLSEWFFLENLDSGTIIRWDDWDRAPDNSDDLMSFISNINNYLAVCFHRYIEKGIIISHHDNLISAISPIPIGEGAELQSSITLNTNRGARQTSYILQHPRNWQEDYENISRFNSFRLFNGFESQQGIYIYRCNRLLNPKGGWFGLLKNSNATKLARVVIDYPNDADELWSLDITKTNASIPIKFKKEIEQLIRINKKGSVNKIIRGNRKVSRSLINNHAKIWNSNNDRNLNVYEYFIDENHPIFRSYIDDKKISDRNLKNLLKLISDNLPISEIINNNDLDPSKHDRMWSRIEMSDSELELAQIIFNSQRSQTTKQQAFTYILNFEPFCYFENELKKLLL